MRQTSILRFALLAMEYPSIRKLNFKDMLKTLMGFKSTTDCGIFEPEPTDAVLIAHCSTTFSFLLRIVFTAMVLSHSVRLVVVVMQKIRLLSSVWFSCWALWYYIKWGSMQNFSNAGRVLPRRSQMIWGRSRCLSLVNCRNKSEWIGKVQWNSLLIFCILRILFNWDILGQHPTSLK